MPRVGRPYGLKHQSRIASELKVSVEGSRAILVDVNLAKKTARQRTTRALNQGFGGPVRVDYAGGQALHEGLLGMAQTRGVVDSETYARIQNMDETVLAEMYSQNKLTFEVAFNYEGLRKTAQGEYEVIGDQKQKDFEFFIGEYNRYAEATGRRTV